MGIENIYLSAAREISTKLENLNDEFKYGKVKVEIQVRTIAMDFWASLEHELSYKLANDKTDDVMRELKECADVIASTDIRMQNLYNITITSKKRESIKTLYRKQIKKIRGKK